MTHICVSKLTIIGSDNGLSPDRRQAIIWTNDGILLTWTLGTNFSEIFSEIYAFSFKKMHLKMSSAKWRPFFSASMCFNIIVKPLTGRSDNFCDLHRDTVSAKPFPCVSYPAKINSLLPGTRGVNLKGWYLDTCCWLNSWALVKLLSGRCQRKHLMTSQNLFMLWLGAVGQEVIT